MPRTAGGGPHIVWPLIMIFASFWWYFLMTGATGGHQKTELGTILSHFLFSLSPLRGWQPLDLFSHEVLTCSRQSVSLGAVFSITEDPIPQLNPARLDLEHVSSNPLWARWQGTTEQQGRVADTRVPHSGGPGVTVCFVNTLWLSLMVKNYQPHSVPSLWLSAHPLAAAVQIQLLVPQEPFIEPSVLLNTLLADVEEENLYLQYVWWTSAEPILHLFHASG